MSPPAVEVLDHLRAAALHAEPRDLQLELGDLRGDALEQPEVEERHAVVVEQQHVARVRVAGELAVAVHRAEVEAEDDLADAVALGLAELLHLLEAATGDVLRDDDLLAREVGDDTGDHDERVAAVDPAQRALVAGLELVVELLVDALADLLADRADVEARRDGLQQPQDDPEVLHVGPHRRRRPRVLHLHRHLAAVVQLGAVDLADRCGRDRGLVEVGEDRAELLAVLALDHLAHVLERDVRRGVAERGELGLELLAVLLGHEADVQEAQHLADLHRRALHRPERGDDLLGGLELARAHRGRRGVLVPREVRRPRAHLAHGLPGGQPAELRAPGHPGGRDRVLRAPGHGASVPRCGGAALARGLGPTVVRSGPLRPEPRPCLRRAGQQLDQLLGHRGVVERELLPHDADRREAGAAVAPVPPLVLQDLRAALMVGARVELERDAGPVVDAVDLTPGDDDVALVGRRDPVVP
jgi:hypothetical protein